MLWLVIHVRYAAFLSEPPATKLPLMAPGLSIYIYIYISIYLSIYLSISLSLSIYIYIYIYIYTRVVPSISAIFRFTLCRFTVSPFFMCELYYHFNNQRFNNSLNVNDFPIHLSSFCLCFVVVFMFLFYIKFRLLKWSLAYPMNYVCFITFPAFRLGTASAYTPFHKSCLPFRRPR